MMVGRSNAIGLVVLNLPPITHTHVRQQFHLLEFLKRRFEQKHRVSVERVVSGPGIANVYVHLVKPNPCMPHP